MINEYIVSRGHQINKEYREKMSQIQNPSEIQGRIEALSSQLEALREDQSRFLNNSIAYRIFNAREYLRIKKAKEEAAKAIPALVSRISREKLDLAKAEALASQARAERRKKLKLLEDKDYVIQYLMKKDPSITGTIGFMLQAVEHDPAYIVYDKTNSNIVFEAYVKAIIEKELNEEKLLKKGYTEREIARIKTGLTALLEEIKNPAVVEDGKYKVPQKYLYEQIKKVAEHYSLQDLAEVIVAYKNVNGVYDKKNGIIFEKLYQDKETYMFLHNTNYRGYKMTEQEINERTMSIMQHGLKLTTMGNEVGKLFYTTLSNVPKEQQGFLRLLEYANGHSSVIVLCIPKPLIDKNQEILGSDTSSEISIENSGTVLPKYVVGCFINGKFIENPIPEEKRTTYKFMMGERKDPEKE